MTKKEQELLLDIADAVGAMFEGLKKDQVTSEITFDQNTCSELWDNYEAWVSHLESIKDAH